MNQNMSVYKPDWAEARQRMINWWEGKRNDRVVASVMAPNSKATCSKTYISDVPARYIDCETVFNNLDYNLEHTFWGGGGFSVTFCLSWTDVSPDLSWMRT